MYLAGKNVASFGTAYRYGTQLNQEILGEGCSGATWPSCIERFHSGRSYRAVAHDRDPHSGSCRIAKCPRWVLVRETRQVATMTGPEHLRRQDGERRERPSQDVQTCHVTPVGLPRHHISGRRSRWRSYNGAMNDRERLEELRVLFHNIEELIPFNRYLGLHADSIDEDGAVVHLDMRDELIGNFQHGVLHGGVISATLDVVGGMAAMVTAVLREESIEDSIQRLRPTSTIDLRVDYLRPGAGERFTARGFTLRAGSRVAVTRMEMHNEKDDLLAVGTGTYIYNFADQ